MRKLIALFACLSYLAPNIIAQEGTDTDSGESLSSSQETVGISVKGLALKADRAFAALKYADCLEVYDEIWKAYAAAYGQAEYIGDYEFDWTFDGPAMYRYARALQAVNGNTVGTAANYLRAYIRLSFDNPELASEIRLSAAYAGASGDPAYDSIARAYVRAMESAKSKGREGLAARFATALIASGKDLVGQMQAISAASWNPYDGAAYQSIEDLCYQLSYGDGLSDFERGALARLSYEMGRDDLFGILYHHSAGFSGEELKAMAKDRAKLSYLDIIASNAPPGVYDDASLRASLLDTLLSNYDAATLDSYGLLDYIPRFTGDWFLDVPKGIIDEARWNAWKLFHDKEIMALYNNGTEGAAAIEDSIEKAFKSLKVAPKNTDETVKAGQYDAAQGFLSVYVGDLAVLRYRGSGASSGASAESWKAKANFEFDTEEGAYNLVSIALSGLPGGKTALIGVPGKVSKVMEEGKLQVSWKAPSVAPSAVSALSFDLGTLDAPKELDNAKPSPIPGIGPRSESFSFQLGAEDAAAFRITYSFGDFDYVLQVEQRGEPFVRTKRYLSYSIDLLKAFASELATVDGAPKAVAVIDGFHGRIKGLLAMQASMQDDIPKLEAGDYPIEVDILLSELQEASDAYSLAFQSYIGPLYDDESVQEAMGRLSEAISE